MCWGKDFWGLLAVLVTTISGAYAQKVYTRQDLFLKGEVASVRVVPYSFKGTDMYTQQMLRKRFHIDDAIAVFFDREGRALQQIYFDHYQEPVGKITIGYKAGQIAEINEFNKGDSLVKRYTYNYHKGGDSLTVQCYEAATGKSYWCRRSSIDKADERVKGCEYSPEGNEKQRFYYKREKDKGYEFCQWTIQNILYVHHKYSKEDSGFITKLQCDGGDEHYELRYIYDNNDFAIKQVVKNQGYYGGESVNVYEQEWYLLYSYDAYGNWIEKRCVNEKGEIDLIVKREITYYSSRLWYVLPTVLVLIGVVGGMFWHFWRKNRIK